MGAKAKYRRAMDAAIAQYGAELGKLTALNAPGTIKPTAYRDATETADDQLNGRDRRMLKQSDKLARTINNDDKFKQRIGQYNERLSILQDQMAGKSVDRFYVDEKPKQPVQSGIQANNPAGILGMAGYVGMGGLQANDQPSGFDRLTLGIQKPDNSYNKDRQYFNTKEEAVAAAKAKAEAYNAQQKQLKPRTNPYNIFAPKAPPPATAEDFVATQTFGGAPTVRGGDRAMRFERLDQGAKDMQALADAIKATPGDAAASAYSALAGKLNARLTNIAKRQEMPVATGLLGSELSKELDTGVLK